MPLLDFILGLGLLSKDKMMSILYSFFYDRPVFTGITGAIGGISPQVLLWVEQAHVLVAFLGSVLGLFSALLAIVILWRRVAAPRSELPPKE